jgi:hypothetical protein
VNWASGFDAQARPVRVPGVRPTAEGTAIFREQGERTGRPSYSPRTGLFYAPAGTTIRRFVKYKAEYRGGQGIRGRQPVPRRRRTRGGLLENHSGRDRLRSLPGHRSVTGERKWELRCPTSPRAAPDDGYRCSLVAVPRLLWLDARTAGCVEDHAWRHIISGPIYSVGGQYVAVTAGNVLFTFAGQ